MSMFAELAGGSKGALTASQGKSDADEGKTVEKKSVTTYHNGEKKLKSTSEKVRSNAD